MNECLIIFFRYPHLRSNRKSRSRERPKGLSSTSGGGVYENGSIGNKVQTSPMSPSTSQASPLLLASPTSPVNPASLNFADTDRQEQF